MASGLTFPRSLTTLPDARAGLVSLSDEVASRLRAHGLYAGAVQITVKDAGFKTITRQVQLASPTHLAKDIAGAADGAPAAELAAFLRPSRMLTVDGAERLAQRRGPALSVRAGGGAGR